MVIIQYTFVCNSLFIVFAGLILAQASLMFQGARSCTNSMNTLGCFLSIYGCFKEERECGARGLFDRLYICHQALVSMNNQIIECCTDIRWPG